MPQPLRLSSLLSREDDLFVALCPELDIASQGPNPAEAQANLAEALGLFLATASPSEIAARLALP